MNVTRSAERKITTSWLLPYAVLTAALALTGLLFYFSVRSQRIQAQAEFEIITDEIAFKISTRLEAYVALLRGGASLFAAETDVTPQMFRAFVARLGVQQRYPGVQGIGYSERVPLADKDRFVQSVRQATHPSFHIWPETPRSEVHTIVFLEPLDRRNAAALGFDMFTERVRRAAMERARDSGTAALSGRVTLVQEIDAEKQPGFLIYVPVYRGGTVPQTVQQRRERLRGFIYSPFRARDLFEGVFGRAGRVAADFRIYDGVQRDDKSLLYSIALENGRTEKQAPEFESTRDLRLFGHQWTLVAQSHAVPRSAGAEFSLRAILFGGTAVALLLFFLTLRETRARFVAEKASRELWESEQRFRQMANTAPVKIWVSGADSQCTFVNRRWLEFRGRTLQQELGEGWIEGLYPEDRKRVLDTYKNAFEARQSFELEFRLKRHDGEYRWNVGNGVPRFTEAGEFLGYIGSAMDINARKNTEDELEQRVAARTSELQAANRELESFTYSVSHDLRAPLRAINAFSDILLTDHGHELSPEARRLFDRVRCNAVQMGQLVDDLLAFSRLGRQPVHTRHVNVTDVVNQALDTLKAQQSDRKVHLRVRRLPMCQADPALLKQVFVSLLSNAFKFTRTREVADIEVGVLEGSSTVFFVKDNGVGFDARYSHKLFGVFQRLHSLDEFEGTGVGLALAHRIVQRHGGRIWAESAPEQGATFYFTLGPGECNAGIDRPVADTVG